MLIYKINLQNQYTLRQYISQDKKERINMPNH